MGDNDFTFIMGCALILFLWGAFNVAYSSNQIESINMQTWEKQDSGVVASLVATTEFLNPFSENFKSDIFIINFFVFGILIFGIAFVGARFIRGV